ncbi:hypothetical protein JCM5353_005841 [Sporobolomyces roseus]
MSTLEDDGFTSVTYKKPSRAPKNRKGKNKYRERTLDEKLQSREEAMRRSGYISECRKMLRTALSPSKEEDNSPSTSACPPPTCVVCLGLGSITDSTKAQDQYVLLKELLMELGELINTEEEPVQFYDPVFTPEDRDFLISQGHKVLSSDYPLRLLSPTLLYIPHGPRTLFNALLESNYSSTQLSKMIILGNRLDLYEDPTYSGTTSQSGQGKEGSELEGGMEWIKKTAPLFNIVPLPTTKEHLEAFNDLALEWVSPSKLEEAVKDGRLPQNSTTQRDKEEEVEINEKVSDGEGVKVAEKADQGLNEAADALEGLQLSAGKKE